jgi:hypothetical protein
MNLSPDQPASDARFQQLRTLVHSIAISIFILAGTVSIFIYREGTLLSRENQQLVEFLQGQENTQQLIDQMRLKLGEFTQKNPDFAPIYTRYFGTNQIVTSTGPTPSPANARAVANGTTNSPAPTNKTPKP